MNPDHTVAADLVNENNSVFPNEQSDSDAIGKFFETHDVSTTLPTFPKVGMTIIDTLQQEDPDVNLVVSLIECEPNISQKVLQLANSPLYAAPRPITTIGHATVMLGFSKIANLATTTAAAEIFDSNEASTFSVDVFKHSLAIATVASVLGEKIGMPNPDEAFMCGVFHDIGKLVIGRALPDFYSQLNTESTEIDSTLSENESLGICHSQLGQHCSKTWGLPETISQAIREHHQTIGEQTQQLSQAMILAVYFAHQWRLGDSSNFCDSKPTPEQEEKMENVFTEQEKQLLQNQAVEKLTAVNEICLG